jgi:pimeloyl-ACP methyl ester carboxylesterase
MPLVAFSEGRVFGERVGQGPPQVLALHGWGRDHNDFRHLLEGLDAIALDLPGFGASPPPPAPWGSADYANAVREVLQRFDRPPVVVGHSFGGRVAVSLAAATGVEVAALVLTGVPLIPRASKRRPSRRYRALRRLHSMHLLGAEQLERARARYGSVDYRRASGVMREVLVRVVNERYDAELGRICCPVELVWGEADTEVPLSTAMQARSMLKDAHVTVCRGDDHYSVLSHSEALRLAIGRHCG